MSQKAVTSHWHEELAVFLGDWRAEVTSYGGNEQSSANPRAGAAPRRIEYSVQARPRSAGARRQGRIRPVS